MFRLTRVTLFAPYIAPMRRDTKHTMPPPVPGDVGGPGGVSIRYSPRISYTPLWERYAKTTFEERLSEAQSHYPYSEHNPADYDVRFLPKPFKDQMKYRPLFEVGERQTDIVAHHRIPVILLTDLKNTANPEHYVGRAGETLWVTSNLMRNELHPRRLAIYASPENYVLLGMEPIDHHVGDEVPRNFAEYQRILKKHEWMEEPWKYSFDYLFRNYGEDGPSELRDVADPWDGTEDVDVVETVAEDGSKVRVKARRKERKAKKVKLW